MASNLQFRGDRSDRDVYIDMSHLEGDHTIDPRDRTVSGSTRNSSRCEQVKNIAIQALYYGGITVAAWMLSQPVGLALRNYFYG